MGRLVCLPSEVPWALNDHDIMIRHPLKEKNQGLLRAKCPSGKEESSACCPGEARGTVARSLQCEVAAHSQCSPKPSEQPPAHPRRDFKPSCVSLQLHLRQAGTQDLEPFAAMLAPGQTTPRATEYNETLRVYK